MENTGVRLHHQDWETYIIHCKADPINKKKDNNSIRKSTNQTFPLENKMNSQIEKGELKHKKIKSTLRVDFKKWRNSKQYTQKDVALKLAVQAQIINKFENGQLNHDPKLVEKIKRIMKK